MRLALYQPDQPPNLGALIRLCACLGVPLDIIEPCGFPLSDRTLKRVAMDYINYVDLTSHLSWSEFLKSRQTARLILLTTKGATGHTEFTFKPTDILLLGRESMGAPPEVHALADARIAIPLQAGLRSLNIVIAAGIVLGEALRQIGGYPPLQHHRDMQ